MKYILKFISQFKSIQIITTQLYYLSNAIIINVLFHFKIEAETKYQYQNQSSNNNKENNQFQYKDIHDISVQRPLYYNKNLKRPSSTRDNLRTDDIIVTISNQSHPIKRSQTYNNLYVDDINCKQKQFGSQRSQEDIQKVAQIIYKPQKQQQDWRNHMFSLRTDDIEAQTNEKIYKYKLYGKGKDYIYDNTMTQDICQDNKQILSSSQSYKPIVLNNSRIDFESEKPQIRKQFYPKQPQFKYAKNIEESQLNIDYQENYRQVKYIKPKQLDIYNPTKQLTDDEIYGKKNVDTFGVVTNAQKLFYNHQSLNVIPGANQQYLQQSLERNINDFRKTQHDDIQVNKYSIQESIYNSQLKRSQPSSQQSQRTSNLQLSRSNNLGLSRSRLSSQQSQRSIQFSNINQQDDFDLKTTQLINSLEW